MITMTRNRQVDFETTRFAEESNIEYTKKKIKITDIIRHPDFKKQFDGKKFNKARFSSYIEKKLLETNELNFQREGINGMVKLFNLYIEESKLSERNILLSYCIILFPYLCEYEDKLRFGIVKSEMEFPFASALTFRYLCLKQK